MVAETESGGLVAARTGMAPVMPPTGEEMPEGPGAWRKHEEALADTVTLVASGPEAGPLAQGVGGVGVAVANGLVDAEVDLYDAGGAVDPGEGTDGGDLADEDDAGGVGHLVEGFFDGLRWRGLLSVALRRKSMKPE